MRQIIWTVWLAALAACEIPTDVKTEMACTTICTCIAGALDRDECIDECVVDDDVAQITEDCFECIQTQANTCAFDACEALCDRPQPEEDDLPDGGMR